MIEETTISPRVKKLIGSAGVLAFLTAYVWLAGTLADLVPREPAVQLGYFVIAGVVWGVPLLPAIKWMNRESPVDVNTRK